MLYQLVVNKDYDKLTIEHLFCSDSWAMEWTPVRIAAPGQTDRRCTT